MKFTTTSLIATLLIVAGTAQAGVVVGGTRLIYDGGKKEASLSVNNPDPSPYLIQSWVETQQDGAEKAPFIITPPLFRLEGKQQNVLRVIPTSTLQAQDKESLYWLNVKSIPSAEKQDNTLQLAIKTRIKLIYRPTALKEKVPEQVTEQLKWRRDGNQLQVTNPTAYYMNFKSIKVNGRELADISFVAPQATERFALPAGVTGSSLSWSLINDFGGEGATHQGTL